MPRRLRDEKSEALRRIERDFRPIREVVGRREAGSGKGIVGVAGSIPAAPTINRGSAADAHADAVRRRQSGNRRAICRTSACRRSVSARMTLRNA